MIPESQDADVLRAGLLALTPDLQVGTRWRLRGDYHSVWEVFCIEDLGCPLEAGCTVVHIARVIGLQASRDTVHRGEIHVDAYPCDEKSWGWLLLDGEVSPV